MPRLDFIAAKRADIAAQIAAIQNKTTVVARIGGLTTFGFHEEIRFQTARDAKLAWAAEATDAEIQAAIATLELELGPAAVACKYGDLSGLPLETMEEIAMIECLELALGTHPAVAGQGV